MNNERDVNADLASIKKQCDFCHGEGAFDTSIPDVNDICLECYGTGRDEPIACLEIAEHWIGETKRIQAENAELRELLSEVMARYRRGVQCREYCGDEDGGELGNTVLGVAVDLEDLEHRINAVTD